MSIRRINKKIITNIGGRRCILAVVQRCCRNAILRYRCSIRICITELLICFELVLNDYIQLLGSREMEPVEIFDFTQ